MKLLAAYFIYGDSICFIHFPHNLQIARPWPAKVLLVAILLTFFATTHGKVKKSDNSFKPSD